MTTSRSIDSAQGVTWIGGDHAMLLRVNGGRIERVKLPYSDEVWPGLEPVFVTRAYCADDISLGSDDYCARSSSARDAGGILGFEGLDFLLGNQPIRSIGVLSAGVLHARAAGQAGRADRGCLGAAAVRCDSFSDHPGLSGARRPR